MCFTHTHPFNGPLSGTIQVSRYQKGKTNLDFTEARDSEWQWGTCKFAPRSRQITVPALHHSVFYRSDALPAQPTASKHWKATTIGTGFFISWMPIPNVCVCMMFVLVVPLRKRWVSMLQTRLRCISITCQFHGRTFWEVSHAVDWLMIRVLCRNAYLHTVSDIFHTELSSRGTVELCCVSKYLGCAN